VSATPAPSQPFEQLRRRLRSWAARSPREWFWAVRRRLHPQRPYRFRFDETLTIEVMLGDELGMHYALGREFEPDVCDFFRRFLRPGMVVFDLGANIGQFTLLAAKRVAPGGAVHAFEPAPSEHAKLRANVALNGFAHVVASAVAVCDQKGEVQLHTAGSGLGIYNSLGKPLWGESGVTVAVPSTTLDDYVREAGVHRLDLIKMDVEGAELAVLRGGAAVFSGPEAPVVVCEFSDPAAAGFGHTTRDLRRAFESFGYRIQRHDPAAGRLVPEPEGERYDYANVVCTKGDVRMTL
jgi:FkbM family methyltransferase